MTLEKKGLKTVKDLYFGKYTQFPEMDEHYYWLVPVVGRDKRIPTPNIDFQKSKYHSESISDHVATVAKRMSTLGNIGIITALFHDCAKVDTLKYNQKGDICFYNHEEKSAELFMKIFNESPDHLGLSYDEAYMIETVIKEHLQLKLLKGLTKECFIEGFKSKFGLPAFKLLEALDRADEGFTETEIKTDEFKALVFKGYECIGSLDFDFSVKY